MSVYRRKIKIKKEATSEDSFNLINALKGNTRAVSISVVAIIIVAGLLSYNKYNSHIKSVELSDRLYADLSSPDIGSLDKVNSYLGDYKGNIANIGRLFVAGGFYEEGKYNEALSNYERLAKTASEGRFKVAAYLGMGHSNLELGKYNEAAEAFKLAFDNAGDAISFSPYRLEARLSLAVSYEMLGENKLASEQYQWVRDNYTSSSYVSPAIARR